MFNKILWIFPFLAFMAGYLTVSYMTYVKQVTTPNLVGLPLADAVKILSRDNLNPRIVIEKEDKDVVPGTILSQTPTAGHQVKQNQPIFLVLAKKPQPLLAPSLVGKSETDCTKVLNSMGVRSKIYYLPSQLDQGTCIAQHPVHQSILEDRKMIVYISSGSNKPMILPNFKNSTVADVKELLSVYQSTIKSVHAQPVAEHVCSSCRIIDQKPLAGSLVDLNQPLYIQLQVE